MKNEEFVNKILEEMKKTIRNYMKVRLLKNDKNSYKKEIRNL
jgi:hypothetical protein